MAKNETFIEAPCEQVFAVLADPKSYGYWVVGSKEIRGFDRSWPEPKSRFYHSVGFGPFTVKDHTEVENSNPPYKLVLRAKARPLGTARVTMTLTPSAEGTHVTMVEDPADPLTAFVFNPLTHLLVRGRNVESLRRLKKLAEEQTKSDNPAVKQSTGI